MSDHQHTAHDQIDHSGHDHSDDHAEHDDGAAGTVDHAAHDHAVHDHGVHAHGAHNHGGHEGHDPAIFKRKFWLSLLLTLPTLVFSTGLQDILGLNAPRFAGSEFIPAVFGIALFFYGGLVFIRGAITELRSRQPGMMTLIALAIIVALGYSLAVTLGLSGMDFWWELATLITIMLLGHWIEMSAVMGAQNALGELAKLIPDEADVMRDGQTVRVPVAELAIDDLVLVRPGAAIPADAIVVDGDSAVNESLITGESKPVTKSVGQLVVAGSINGSGALTVQVDKLGDDTAVAGIMKLVADAQASKSGAQVLADRAAALLFYVALGAAVITLVVWLLLMPGNPSFVLERVVAVLVIACPHALGLAIPLVSLIATSKGARAGILVKKKLALEDARHIDVVVFDKTGTLTEGRQGVVDVLVSARSVAGGIGAEGSGEAAESADGMLALAAAVEARSEHPIATAIVERAAGLPIAPVSSFAGLTGRGAEGMVDGRVITVASRGLLTERGILLDAELVNSSRQFGAEGKTVVYVLADGQVLGIIALADVIRPESAEAVAQLQARGVRVAMLTGDTLEVGNWVAAQLKIREVFAEVLPGQKADVVRKLQGEGTKVAMVGDGVNDAPALTQADVAIAIGAGTDVAIESAGIVLASSDPRAVVDLLKLSSATYRKEVQNLWWAAGYNVIGIPLAAGVLFGAGVLLPPALAAVFMSVSTIVVALNAQLLRTLKLRT